MIYVHVPFCESFCTYCDFYSEIACRSDRNDRKEKIGAYVDDVCSEIISRKEEIIQTLKPVNTLYIGGGTPSVLDSGQIGIIANAIRKAIGTTAGTPITGRPDLPFGEFTIEVNPEDIIHKGEAYVRELLDIGVNRFSMGVQSLDDATLRWMNRRHNAAGALEAFRILRSAGAMNISLDLIYGCGGLLPVPMPSAEVSASDTAAASAAATASSFEALNRTLEGLIGLKPEHISAYQLTVEEGSALAKLIKSGKYTELPDEECRRQYLRVCEALKEAGYEHYEISNWALPGHRAVHNSAYWVRAPYVGVGPGAHSLEIRPDGQQLRKWNPQDLDWWRKTDSVDGRCGNKESLCNEEILSPEEIREEEIMLGMRTAEGWNGHRLSEEQWFVSDSIIADLI